jgi:hypothetical protein
MRTIVIAKTAIERTAVVVATATTLRVIGTREPAELVLRML